MTNYKIGSDVIKKYSPLVRRLASQVISRVPLNIEIDDLIQVGMIGLVEAFDRYDSSHNASFETFATTRINGAMLDELRSNDWMSRGDRHAAKSIDATVNKLAHKLGRRPTDSELATQLDLPIDSYIKLSSRVQSQATIYLEDLSGKSASEDGDADGNGFLDRYIDERPMLLDELIDDERRRQVVKAMEMLHERERHIMDLVYDQDMSFTDISTIFGVSPTRIGQLHKQAINRLAILIAASEIRTIPAPKPDNTTKENAEKAWLTANLKGFSLV